MNKVAVLVYEGFTLFEIAVAINILSRKYLIEFVSLASGSVRSEEGMQVVPDQVVTPALVVDYAGLLVPGAADMQALLDTPAATEVVQAFDRAGKTIAAICGAGALLGRADPAHVRKARVAARALRLRLVRHFRAVGGHHEGCFDGSWGINDGQAGVSPEQP